MRFPSRLAAFLRQAAEWAALTLAGGALGLSAYGAVQAGLVSEQALAVVVGTLYVAALAFGIWSVRALCLTPWDEWDEWARENDRDPTPDT